MIITGDDSLYVTFRGNFCSEAFGHCFCHFGQTYGIIPRSGQSLDFRRRSIVGDDGRPVLMVAEGVVSFLPLLTTRFDSNGYLGTR